MATLPDGKTVTSQFTEGWEEAITGLTSQFTEGWEEAITGLTSQFIEGWEQPVGVESLTMSLTPTPTTTGETATASGKATDEVGAAKQGVEVTVEVLDQNGIVLQEAADTTDATGLYSADVFFKTDRAAVVRATTPTPGIGSQPIAFGRGRVEGWEA